jgi:outer membrane protein OmpA-like peptidoglycan-associated protein
LKSQGLINTELTAIGVGTKQSLPPKANINQGEINRSVTFKVFLTDKLNFKTNQ